MRFTTYNSAAPPGFGAVTNSSLYIADITLTNATIQPAIYLQLIVDTSLFPTGFISFLRFSVLRNDRVQALFQFMEANGQFTDAVSFANVPASSFPYEITLFFIRDDEVLAGIEEDGTEAFPYSDQFDINVIVLGAASGPLLQTPAAEAQFTITRAEGLLLYMRYTVKYT